MATTNCVVIATILALVLCAYTSSGVPLRVLDKPRQLYPYVVQENCFRLMHLVSITHSEFAKERFKDETYDHFIILPGIEPVLDFAALSNEEFLKEQVVLFYQFKQMIQEITAHERKRTSPGSFKDKFQEINNKVNDILAWLRHIQSSLNYHVTNSMPVYPTMKPKATQKEQDEWTLMVLKELTLSLLALAQGSREKMAA